MKIRKTRCNGEYQVDRSPTALLLLENHNTETTNAEIHYIPVTLEEWSYFYQRIQPPNFLLSFTVNHVHLVPEGVGGFCDGSISIGWPRCASPTAIGSAMRCI